MQRDEDIDPVEAGLEPESVTLEDAINDVQTLLPGWTWLVRNDAAYGAFANLYGAEFGYPTYGETPVIALAAAIRRALTGENPCQSMVFIKPTAPKDIN